MANNTNKDDFEDPAMEYEKQRLSFISDLRRFNSNRGTPFTSIPQLGGQEVDLYYLYQKVTSMGGWQKVHDYQWEDFQQEFGLPLACCNSAQVLKHIYFRYLNLYEKVNFLGEVVDHRSNEDEDGPSRKKICLPIESIPLSYNHAQHKLSDASRQQLNLPGERPERSPYQQLEMSLLSGLPNEVDLALNICLLLSTEGKHVMKLGQTNLMLRLLLAHVAVFEDDCDDLQDLCKDWMGTSQRNFLRFWYESVQKENIRKLITWQGRPYTQNQLVGSEVLNLGRDLGTLDPEGQRALQLAVFLHNLSFEEINQKILASSCGVFKFLMLSLHNSYDGLRQLALDTLANLASEFHLNCLEGLSCPLMLDLLNSALFSEDRFLLVRGLEMLSKICQVSNNVSVLSESLREDVYSHLVALLTVQDIQLIVHTLEALYKLSKVGDPFTTRIARVHKAIDTLVSLVTIEAQSFGPGSLVGIKVVEYVPPSTTGTEDTDTVRRATTVIQPINPDSINIYQVPSGGAANRPAVEGAQAKATNQGEAGKATPQPPPPPELVTDIQATTVSWLNATYEEKKKSKVNQVELFSDYLQFCRKFQLTKPMSSSEFLQTVKVQFSDITVTTINRKNGATDVFYENLSKRSTQRPFAVTTLPPEKVRNPLSVNVSPPVQQAVLAPLAHTPTLRQRLMEPPRMSLPSTLPHAGAAVASSTKTPAVSCPAPTPVSTPGPVRVVGTGTTPPTPMPRVIRIQTPQSIQRNLAAARPTTTGTHTVTAQGDARPSPGQEPSQTEQVKSLLAKKLSHVETVVSRPAVVISPSSTVSPATVTTSMASMACGTSSTQSYQQHRPSGQSISSPAVAALLTTSSTPGQPPPPHSTSGQVLHQPSTGPLVHHQQTPGPALHHQQTPGQVLHQQPTSGQVLHQPPPGQLVQQQQHHQAGSGQLVQAQAAPSGQLIQTQPAGGHILQQGITGPLVQQPQQVVLQQTGQGLVPRQVLVQATGGPSTQGNTVSFIVPPQYRPTNTNSTVTVQGLNLIQQPGGGVVLTTNASSGGPPQVATAPRQLVLTSGQGSGYVLQQGRGPTTIVQQGQSGLLQTLAQQSVLQQPQTLLHPQPHTILQQQSGQQAQTIVQPSGQPMVQTILPQGVQPHSPNVLLSAPASQQGVHLESRPTPQCNGVHEVNGVVSSPPCSPVPNGKVSDSDKEAILHKHNDLSKLVDKACKVNGFVHSSETTNGPVSVKPASAGEPLVNGCASQTTPPSNGLSTQTVNGVGPTVSLHSNQLSVQHVVQTQGGGVTQRIIGTPQQIQQHQQQLLQQQLQQQQQQQHPPSAQPPPRVVVQGSPHPVQPPRVVVQPSPQSSQPPRVVLQPQSHSQTMVVQAPTHTQTIQKPAPAACQPVRPPSQSPRPVIAGATGFLQHQRPPQPPRARITTLPPTSTTATPPASKPVQTSQVAVGPDGKRKTPLRKPPEQPAVQEKQLLLRSRIKKPGVPGTTPAPGPRQGGMEYMCEWGPCRRIFPSARLAFLHVFRTHIPSVSESSCQWAACEKLIRKRWSLVSHVQDHHCSELGMRTALQRRMASAQSSTTPAPPAPPQPMIYPPDAAMQAIRRFSIKPPYPEFAEQREGPVSKHIRLTAALILRNVCKYSPAGRRQVRRHEQLLSYNVMNTVESSTALAHCLWEVIRHCEPQPPL